MLVSLAVIALGFLLLASFVIALGASSTERFEFERNRVQPQRQRSTVASGGGLAGWAADSTRAVFASDAEVRAEQGMPVGVATHPAGRRLGQPESAPAWWLVDEAGDDPVDAVLAGPFADRIDADWAALSAALARVGAGGARSAARRRQRRPASARPGRRRGSRSSGLSWTGCPRTGTSC